MKENTYFKYVIVILLFLLLAFDRDMAMIYILILVGDWFWWKLDEGKLDYPLSKPGGTMDIVFAIGGTVAFFIITSMALKLFTGQAVGWFGTGSIIELLATSTPILQGSAILTVIGWGILIPLIESSFFFGRLFEGISSTAKGALGKINPYKFSIPIIIVMAFVSGLFTIFHITAKGFSNEPLIATFIFGMISCALVVYTKSLKSAILFHVIINTMAVASLVGWI